MGEVRIKIKITNTADQVMARRGQMELSEVRFYEADAMADTGAVSTVLPFEVVNALGLSTPRQRGVEYADAETR